VLGKVQREEGASSPGEAVQRLTDEAGADGGPLNQLKARFEEAKAAAKEAAAEKESELLRRYNEATKTD
jgi:hypothetical protein